MPSEEDGATAIGNMHENYLVKFGSVVFESCEQIERQTDRQTHSSQYFAVHTPPAGTK